MRNPPGSRATCVVHYPSLRVMAGNPYWAMLESGLKEAGIKLLDEPDAHKLRWLFKNRNRVGILHFHYFQFLYCNRGRSRARLVYVARFALFLLLARLLGYRTVLTLHNLKPTHPLNPAWIDYLGHWLAANFTQRVIVHCHEARRLLAARYGRKNNVIEVAHPHYLGYASGKPSKTEARKILRLPPRSPVFLFFGGVRRNKGLENLIQTFKEIEEREPTLLIAGKPEPGAGYAEQLQSLAGKDPRIRFHFGYIPDEELALFFNASDIVVLPFSAILTSSSTILAMSFARAVIAPRMGCLPELLEPGAGWLYEADSPGALLQTLGRSLKEDWRQAGVTALERVTRHTPAIFIRETLSCYGCTNSSA